MSDALFPTKPQGAKSGPTDYPVWVLFVLEDVLKCLETSKMTEAAELVKHTIHSIETSIDAAMVNGGDAKSGKLIAFPRAQPPKPERYETKLSGVDG